MIEQRLDEYMTAKLELEALHSNLINEVALFVLSHLPDHLQLSHVEIVCNQIYIHIGWGIGKRLVLFGKSYTLQQFKDRFVKENNNENR